MPPADRTTALIASFAEHGQAERFVAELRQAGFSESQIGVVAPGHAGSATPVEDSAAAGALTGGAWGVLLGAALAAGLIPGIGPVLAGGILAGILGGAAVGATAGTLVGALVGLGIGEEKARHYQQQLLAGHTLVVVEPRGRLLEAEIILRRMETPPADDQPGLEELDQLT